MIAPMKTCEECRQEIDTEARRCSHCGTRQMGTPRRVLNIFGTSLLLIVGALILLWLVAPFWR